MCVRVRLYSGHGLAVLGQVSFRNPRAKPIRTLMIVVLSPHADDAVLSLGAWIAAKTDQGADIHVVTVFANDVDSKAPPSLWDRRAGFARSCEAARARRDEDRKALELLGATVTHLPFPDSSYVKGERNAEEIHSALVEAIGEASAVLTPGFPLVHNDHKWLTELVQSRPLNGARLAYYTEQPYAWWSRRTTLESVHLTPARWRHVRRKVAATRCYPSQLPLLGGRRVIPRLLFVDVFGGGEKLHPTPDLATPARAEMMARRELLALAAA
jgi:LmbE family N-acetylglucosaminyl deacetylase